MAHNISGLRFPKMTTTNALRPEFIINWGGAGGVRAFFQTLNAHPYDRWENMFSLVPYRNKGTLLSSSFDRKHITIQMPRGHTDFEYKIVQILVDLKSCGYAFAGILQRHSSSTELQDLFACARGILRLDATCNSQTNRDAITDSLRKLVSGNSELQLVAAEQLSHACDLFSRTYKDFLDPVNATTETIGKLFAGLVSGTTQLEAFMSGVRGKTVEQLESSGTTTWPAQYWLTYAQRIDQTLTSLDLSALDTWQACWSALQSNFGSIIFQAHSLGDTFLEVNRHRHGGLPNLVASTSDVVSQFREMFELADQTMLIARQFVEAEGRMKAIFWGINCDHPLVSFPVS